MLMSVLSEACEEILTLWSSSVAGQTLRGRVIIHTGRDWKERCIFCSTFIEQPLACFFFFLLFFFFMTSQERRCFELLDTRVKSKSTAVRKSMFNLQTLVRKTTVSAPVLQHKHPPPLIFPHYWEWKTQIPDLREDLGADLTDLLKNNLPLLLSCGCLLRNYSVCQEHGS